jgi:hypothetical protein
MEWEISASGQCWWHASIGDNTETIKKKESLMHASKEVGLEIITENYVYIGV